jgi:hypothetical protein
MTDPQKLNSCKKHFNGWTAQVVSDQKIRVKLINLMDQSLEHLLFIRKDNYVWLALLRLLDCIIGKGDLVEFSEQSEVLKFLFFGGTILINLLLDDCRDYCDLSSVLSTSGHFARKCHTDQRWWRFVNVLDWANNTLGIFYFDLVSAPTSLMIDIDNALGIFDCKPTGTLDLSFENKELEHWLLASKNCIKSIAGQTCR